MNALAEQIEKEHPGYLEVLRELVALPASPLGEHPTPERQLLEIRLAKRGGTA